MGDAPQPGDIWSCRIYERRARVLRVYPSGVIRLRTVIRIGGAWQEQQGDKTSTCSVYSFAKNYRLLARAL